MNNYQFFDVVLLALLAGFIAFRLYSVLGRRTGNERTPDTARSNPQSAAKENLRALPDRSGGPTTTAIGGSGTLSRALLDIKLYDRGFDTEHFMSGSRAAYEMIVTAFAHGDRDVLKPLLSPEVFEAFDEAIKHRETKKERVEFTFLSLKSARITAAEMKGQTAEITVAFNSQVMLAGYDPNGALIEGDAKSPQEIVEYWTYARDVRSSNPNWTLISTTAQS
ncbi:MAG TPA: Tim44/TimA family putative adaptor protein [Micropepsaceae bacterium]|nr:Tim44/TimA family putative adaptor protein [Micropepsaceae bacterium]